MRQHERGEIATLLMLGSLVVIAVSAVASSFFVNKKQTTSSKAALACPANQCAGSTTCVDVGKESNGLTCCAAGQNKAHPEWTWATWGASCNTGEAHYGDDCCYIRTGTNAGGIAGCTKAEDWNNFGTCTSSIIKCQQATKDNKKVCLEKADAPPAGGGGGECPGKLNIQNKCDDACCETDTQCPSGQKCNIPNGNCKSGKSCNPSPWGSVIQKKIDGKCVYQPCMSQPCVDEAGCGSNTGGGQTGGVICPPPAYGPVYEWADYGKTCVCMNCVVWQSGCASNDGKPGSKPTVVDGSMCCLPGQKGAGGTACGQYTVTTCGKDGKSCCPADTGKEPCEAGLTCDGTTCKAPEAKPQAPSANCEWFGSGSCTQKACLNVNSDYTCTADKNWCCPGGGAAPVGDKKCVAGQTTEKFEQCGIKYCTGGNGNNYLLVLGSYYDSSCNNINATVKTYCGCPEGGQTGVCAGQTSTRCTDYCTYNGGGGNGRLFFEVGGTLYDEKCGAVTQLKPDYCGCSGASHSYGFTGKVKGSDASKAVKASLSYAGTNGVINQGSLPATISGGSYSYSGTFGPEVTETTQCKVNILDGGSTILGSTSPFACLSTTALLDVIIGTDTGSAEVACPSNKKCGTTCCLNATDTCTGAPPDLICTSAAPIVYGDAQCKDLGEGAYCTTSKADRSCGTDATTETVCGPTANDQTGKCCTPPSQGSGTMGVNACYQGTERKTCSATAQDNLASTLPCTSYGYAGKYTYTTVCQGRDKNYACKYQCKNSFNDWLDCKGNLNDDGARLCIESEAQTVNISLTIENLNELTKYQGMTVTKVAVGLCKTVDSCEFKDLDIPSLPYNGIYTKSAAFSIKFGDQFTWVTGFMKDSSNNIYQDAKEYKIQPGAVLQESYNLKISGTKVTSTN